MAAIDQYRVTGGELSASQSLDIAARLNEGALIVYPTDTLYAIGCRALDGSAVRRLRDAKGREAHKPLPVIAADLEQARSLTTFWPEEAQRLAAAFWPGPLTLVLPAAATLPPELLAGASTIAVRVPALEVSRTLARAAGPLVSTSANLAGEPPCITVEQAMAAFPQAALAIDIGPLDGAPSTLVDLNGPQGSPRILREGRIPAARILSITSA